METKRLTVATAEEILGEEFPCLDKGFVRLVDYLGGDARIVQSARVSYGDGTKTVREDEALIRYLLKNRHTSPFEQVVLTFHCKMPIFVARQWVRHRTARLNEVSGRYSVMKDEFYIPAPENIQFQSKSNKQGRGDEVPPELRETVLAILKSDQQSAYDHYSSLIGDGVAKELARINLPLSLYTEWYWQIDLHNLFHFLGLRLDGHAQYEIRVYAEALYKCAKAVAPYACQAFEDYQLNAVTFSGPEMQVLRSIFQRCAYDGVAVGVHADAEVVASLVWPGGITTRDIAGAIHHLPDKDTTAFLEKLVGRV